MQRRTMTQGALWLSLCGLLSACGSEDPEATTGGSGGAATGSGATTGSGGAGGTATDGAGGALPSGTGCNGLSIAPTTDYAADGPYGRMLVENTGPDGQYTLFRPAPAAEGVTFPIATWGNGITTTPANYTELLGAIASHGFVIVASNSSTVNAQLMTAGLDWLIAQNDVPGELQGLLETECATTIGYSLGGGAAIGSGNHPSVKATVHWHGLQGPSEQLSAPLLIITATVDGFVTKQANAQPSFDRSTVPTVMATLDFPGEPANFAGHTIPLQDGAGPERAPAVAWLRYWIYGDEGARNWFFGDSCQLCMAPWIDIQRKNHDW